MNRGRMAVRWPVYAVVSSLLWVVFASTAYGAPRMMAERTTPLWWLYVVLVGSVVGFAGVVAFTYYRH
ncbi:hypothetical protein [Halosegnis marinus]|uniref:DUF2530 domain-containing protein n=1 Tax=Halosegnis marinus TaxID=3034023 RepID=A0ABD5ZS10_9EURY|nr:hypothetical protein [Halosegnis sp. DT85]